MQRPIFNRLIFVLALAGIFIAGLLWKWHANPGDIPCGGSGGCERVAYSPYSRFPYETGPPVSAWGTFAYLGIFGLTFARTLFDRPSFDQKLRLLIFLGALFGTGFSLYLTYAEIFLIKAICKWCVASQCIILTILGLSVAETALLRRAVPASPPSSNNA